MPGAFRQGSRGVDVNDVLLIIAVWETSTPNGDFNDDGLVDADDVLILLSHFGEACP
ncbi:MAG: GC-type dockerin domain-anchored protein [Phycisphaerales bacterium]|nr:GC-type dockerin domain-anchored protein [Phycisphaerales bacterium]